MSGTLVAIGGALDLQSPVLQHFYEKAGAAEGKFVILPTASSRLEAGVDVGLRLKELGAQQVFECTHARDRAGANDPAALQAVDDCTGIFMTGGNQLRLTSILGGTRLHTAMLAAYERGAVVAGTSAGAAAMSTVMIAHGNSGQAPRNGMAQFSPGLGFTNQVFFDQHFSQRVRIGRLLVALALYPGWLAIGIDESTAVILSGEWLDVLGSGSVTVLDGTHLAGSTIADINARQLAAISGVQLHVLTNGCRFNMLRRVAVLPIPVLDID